jgi:glycosidase
MCRLYFLIILGFFSSNSFAQIVTLDPPFATQDDDVTITYNAALGNAVLIGVSPVYMHTGVITNFSDNETDWQHVQGVWGTADANVLMTTSGVDLWEKTININDFYSLLPGEIVTQLAFVFRNSTGSIVGKTTDNQDIFVDIFTTDFSATILSPQPSAIYPLGDFSIEVNAASNGIADLQIYLNSNLLQENLQDSLINTTVNTNTLVAGTYWIKLTANNGFEVVEDSVSFIMQPPVTIQDPPSGTEDGINYISDTSVILQLFAPYKDYAYAIGDFSNWQPNLDYFMKKNVAGDRFWILINGLIPGQEYRYQYQIDQEAMRIPDVYSKKIINGFDDNYIDEETYPELIEYPSGLTNNNVSILQTAQTPFDWQYSNDFVRPEKDKLVIYELLVRDFIGTHNYQTLIDTLDYFENLGINAIELMPVSEFEGNESWGYSVSFHYAQDKYYGTEKSLKEFVDACHQRGISVIVDVVFNHSFGQNPQVSMWFDPSEGEYGEPTAENPFFNPTATHPFSVGYDYNHESEATQYYIDKCLKHWLTNYKIDGFRFDLSKGFTQNITTDVGVWGNYDQSRIDNLLRIKSEIDSIDDQAYLILEHLGADNEEQVLANNGFMMWGNVSTQYQEAAMGYASNLSRINHQTHGFTYAHLVGYAQSHDEERLMFKNLEFGNQSGLLYDVRDLNTALARQELVANFLIPVRGSKMIWQFDELGYDYSINTCSDGITIDEDCRTANKPIRWDYQQEPARLRLYKVMAALNKLKINNPSFSSNDYSLNVSNSLKRIKINHPDMNVIIIGNFGVNEGSIVPEFQHTGTWFEYYTGQSIVEENLLNAFLLQPGEYRLYTDLQLEQPDLSTNIKDITIFDGGEIMSPFPNPFNAQVKIDVNLIKAQNVKLEIFNMNGKIIKRIFEGFKTQGIHSFNYNALGENVSEGLYFVKLSGKDFSVTKKLSYQK